MPTTFHAASRSQAPGRDAQRRLLRAELAPDGRISTIRPHLRPWLALTFLALKFGPRLVRHPDVLRGAVRATPG